MSEETVVFNLELNVEAAFDNVRKIEMLTYRTLGLLGRLGLPENVREALALAQRLAMTFRLLHTAMVALAAARAASGDVLALWQAIVSAGALTSSVLATGDAMMEVNAR